MPRSKPTPVATRHGATQPEDARKAKAILLRLLPMTTRRLDVLAKQWECSRSEAVARLVEAS